MVDFGAGARRGGARDGHAVDLNDRNTRAIQVTACRRADHRSHRAAPERHRPDHRALSHPPDASREFFGAGVVSPSRLRKGFGRESASETQTGNARARLTMATHAHLDPPARIAWRGPVNARRARRGDPTGRPRRAPRVAGTPDVHANEDRTSRRGARLVPSASADDGREDAAEAARLAPLEASTAMGAELERILKTDPVAFDRALSDQVGCAPSLPPPGRNPYSLSEFTLFWPTHLGFALAAAPPFGRMRRPTRTDAVMEGPRVDVFEPAPVAFGNNTRLGPRVARFPPRIPPRTKSATTTFVPWNSRLITSQKNTRVTNWYPFHALTRSPCPVPRTASRACVRRASPVVPRRTLRLPPRHPRRRPVRSRLPALRGAQL